MKTNKTMTMGRVTSVRHCSLWQLMIRTSMDRANQPAPGRLTKHGNLNGEIN